MTQQPEFNVALSTVTGPSGREVALAAHHGVSIGHSSDGAVSVAILGGSGARQAAQSAAEAIARDHTVPSTGSITRIGLVVIDHRRGEALVWAAPIAHRPTYWSASAVELRVSSDPRKAAPSENAAPAVSADDFFRYVYFHMLPGPATPYRGVSRLHGGHRLCWNDARGHGCALLEARL